MFDLDISFLANVLSLLAFLLVGQLATAPTITCPFGKVPVAVLVWYGEPIPHPLEGVDVEFFQTASGWKEPHTTDIAGLAQGCVSWGLFALGIRVRKSGFDFGAGKGNWFELSGVFLVTGPVFREVKPVPVIPKVEIPVVLPCFGSISVETPDWRERLSKPALPSDIPVFVKTKVRGVPASVPFAVFVGGRGLYTVTPPASGDTSIEVLRLLRDVGVVPTGTPPSILATHTIRLESRMLDCDIPAVELSVPKLVPTGVVVPTCRELATKVESVSIPVDVLPADPTVPFFVQLWGVKEFCPGDPTNPAFISKITGVGTIYLGNLSASFDITDGASEKMDLSKKFDLSRLVPTAAPVVAPLPVAVAPSICEKSGSIGEPGRYFVSLSEVQSFLNACYPGGVAQLAPVGDPWYGAFKIVRGAGGRYPAGSYFWTKTWEDIRRLY